MRLYLTLLLIFIISVGVFAENIEKKNIYEKKTEYEININYPYLTESNSVANSINSNIKSLLTNRITDFKTDFYGFKPINPCALSSDYDITLNGHNLLSGDIRYYSYTGGAHPISFTDTINYYIKDNSAVEIKLFDIFDASKINELKKLILTELNKEKASRGVEPLADFSSIDDMSSFTIDHYGINFIFDPMVAGAYVEGGYKVSIDFARLKPYLSSTSVINDYFNNTKARVNIDGTIYLNDMKKVPANAKCVIKLVWIPTNKPAKVLETHTYDFTGYSMPYKNSFDFTKLDDKNEYQIVTQVLFDGVVAYENELQMPLTSAGWPEDSLIFLYDVNSANFKSNELNKIGYMRLTGDIAYYQSMLVPFSYLEFRLLDKDKVVKKAYVPFSQNPMKYDVAFNTKGLTDKTYNLVIYLKNGNDVLFEVIDKLSVSKSVWTLPKSLVLVEPKNKNK